MKTYRFIRSVTCDGTARTDGETLAETDFAPGSLGPCLRLGHVIEVIETPPPANTADPAADEDQPAKTAKRK